MPLAVLAGGRPRGQPISQENHVAHRVELVTQHLQSSIRYPGCSGSTHGWRQPGVASPRSRVLQGAQRTGEGAEAGDGQGPGDGDSP